MRAVTYPILPVCRRTLLFGWFPGFVLFPPGKISMQMLMSMQYWWNDNDRQNTQVVRTELVPLPFVQNSGFHSQRPMTNHLRHGMARQKLKVLFYPMLPDFWKRTAFWKVPRVHSLVLLVREMYRWRWVWSNGETIFTWEKLKFWEKNLSQCHFVQHTPHMDWPWIEFRWWENGD